jgi:DNA-binding winged helix-turn-helix (wHTH) protein
MPPSLTFDAFRLDLENERLLCDDEVVSITPKAFAVLRCLVGRSGELVRKDEIMRAAWPDTHVGAGVLKVAILEIRRALGDDSAAPRFVETVPRLGYRFVAPRTVPRPGPGAGPARPVVGRDAVLERLGARFTRAVDGERQLVLVSGEAGIGKTTVVDAFIRRIAAEPRVRLGRGECLEHHGVGEAYLPVLDALGRLCREPGGERIADALAEHAPTWIAHLPAAVRRREIPHQDLVAATRERMLREMAEALEIVSADSPLVLVLEDLHWSDFSTLDLLAMVARRPGPARLLVVGTYRPVDAIVSEHPLRGVARELRARGLCEEIPLELLSAPEVAAYADARFPGHAFPSELSAAIHRRTDGNALFMVRLADELVAVGALAEAGGRWRLARALDDIAGIVPETLRELIEQQVARLVEDQQRALEAASLVGREFTAAAVASALEVDPERVEECCDALARRGSLIAPAELLALPDGSALAQYRFTHALYPTVLAGGIPPAKRVRLHKRLAEWIETAYGAETARVAADLARHHEEARNLPAAIEWLRRAAGGDLRRFASHEAVARLSHALELLKRFPAAEAERMLPILHDQIGRAHRAGGDFRAAAEAFAVIERWAHERGLVAWEARSALYRASVLSWTDVGASLQAAATALALGDRVEEPALQAHIRGAGAFWRLHWEGWRAEDERLVEQAVEAARASNDAELLSHSVLRLSLFQSTRLDLAASLRTVGEAIDLSREVGEAYDHLGGYSIRCGVLRFMGDCGAALACVEEGCRIAERNGHVPWVGYMSTFNASIHLDLFDFEGAVAIMRPACGRLPPGPNRFEGLSALGIALVGLERLDEAAAVLAPVDRDEGPGKHGVGRPWRLEALSALALARGDAEGALQFAEQFAAAASAAGNPSARAVAARQRAEAALAAGDAAAAVRYVEEGLAALGDADVPPFAWRLHAVAARAHAGRRRTADADAARGRARALVARIADSLAADLPIRATFLAHPLVAEVTCAKAEATRAKAKGRGSR